MHLKHSHFAAVAEVEVWAIEAFMTNADDRSCVATIAGDVPVNDWTRATRVAVVIEWMHRGDGASSGDRSGDELERVIKRSTMNCVCRKIPGAFTTLEDRRPNVSSEEWDRQGGSR